MLDVMLVDAVLEASKSEVANSSSDGSWSAASMGKGRLAGGVVSWAIVAGRCKSQMLDEVKLCIRTPYVVRIRRLEYLLTLRAVIECISSAQVSEHLKKQEVSR